MISRQASLVEHSVSLSMEQFRQVGALIPALGTSGQYAQVNSMALDDTVHRLIKVLSGLTSKIGRHFVARVFLLPPGICRLSLGFAELSQVRDGRSMMTSRRTILQISALFLAGNFPALAASRVSPIKMFDTDADGTLDLAEVKKAASALFAKLDRDHDGTLDKHELAGRLSARELGAADPDHDGTLTLDEYLAIVEQRFNAANPDSDGTLDAKELNTPAGQALLRLLA
jgi:hypothetical protein